MSDNRACVGVNKCNVDSECGSSSSSLSTESEASDFTYDHEVIVYCIQKLVNFCFEI